MGDTREEYDEEFGNKSTHIAGAQNHFQRPTPSKKTILSWVEIFQQPRSVTNHIEGHSGRPCTTRSNENVGRVMEKVLQSPKKSFRCISKELQLQHTDVWRMVKELGACSYWIQVLHELRPPDYRTHLQYCAHVLACLYEDEHSLDNWWLSDECHVLLSGHINKQNIRFLGWEKPDEYLQRPLHSEKVTVWSAISSHGVIGPYFTENDNGETIIDNAAVYRQVLTHFDADLQTL
ncbi:hypothetical protein ANN_04710 [Periplaneta americana]|uniref:Uncharacterized protein n=1 Tax=Periplaneta americana TaxID=6978 RepID=A0ABQ8TB44_PERAM|nr:hypothetical protein ANN_04710 [Periplaneta americana]